MARPLTPTYLFTFIALLSYQFVSAQSSIPPLGQADMAELDLTKCSFDHSAPAMYLLNSQETRCNV